MFNHSKYIPFQPLNKTDRRWPSIVIDKAPCWCSVDLRDGNQALIDPMTPKQKLLMFEMLVEVGFKQIEVGFPSASQHDFDFIRQLITEQRIPEDVTIQVLTQARKELIERTYESLYGVSDAIVHLYNPTSAVQRERVFKMSRQEIKKIAVDGARWVLDCAHQYPGTRWQFQYSPESFTGTEIDYAVDVCDAVAEIWQPTPDNKIIFNLPATVEMATPNIYADQIETFCDTIHNRESVIVSLHTHNDRGCGVAASELGLMAGGDRVEGTLLGNGERTGNLDIVIMAMNLYSQGIDPELDLSSMDMIIHVVEQCTNLKVHPRHPYAGELVFSAFSGGHQDAIKKCLDVYQKGDPWRVCYLPIDPRDIGRNYQEVIRINSQSGKGGVAYILESEYAIKIPRWLQIDFSSLVQHYAETKEREVATREIYTLFCDAYITPKQQLKLQSYQVNRVDKGEKLRVTLADQGGDTSLSGTGSGALEVFVNCLGKYLGESFVIVEYAQHTLGNQEHADAIAYVQISIEQQRVCGVGRSQDILSASFNAVLAAIARRVPQQMTARV